MSDENNNEASVPKLEDITRLLKLVERLKNLTDESGGPNGLTERDMGFSDRYVKAWKGMNDIRKGDGTMPDFHTFMVESSVALNAVVSMATSATFMPDMSVAVAQIFSVLGKIINSFDPVDKDDPDSQMHVSMQLSDWTEMSDKLMSAGERLTKISNVGKEVRSRLSDISSYSKNFVIGNYPDQGKGFEAMDALLKKAREAEGDGDDEDDGSLEGFFSGKTTKPEPDPTEDTSDEDQDFPGL